MKFSNVNMCHMKMFKSLFSLEFKYSEMERCYQVLFKNSIGPIVNYFSKFLIFFGIFLTTMEGVLFFSPGESKNIYLTWNFYFTFLNLIMSIVIFTLTQFTKVTQDYKNAKYIMNFFIHFVFENFFLSLISMLLLYFKMEIEVISFTFIAQTLSKLLLSLFLHRSFKISLTNICVSYSFKLIFLLRLHFSKAIVYYLILNFAFQSIVLVFVYLYEFMTRKFLYSFVKLTKEKECFLETLNNFNISYFSSKNRQLTKAAKLDYLLEDQQSKESEPNLESIKEVIRTSLISISQLPDEVEKYLAACTTTKKFKFKKLVRILSSTEENRTFFRKFTSAGILKIPRKKEDIFIQVFLKIKIKDERKHRTSRDELLGHDSEARKYSENFVLENGLDVKIEGVFLDISQVYRKKETQVNSFILSKYINDIKCPLMLLQKILKTNGKFFKKEKDPVPAFTEGVNSSLGGNAKEIATHHYLKTISKYIFEIIENINNFTKRRIIYPKIIQNQILLTRLTSANSSIIAWKYSKYTQNLVIPKNI